MLFPQYNFGFLGFVARCAVLSRELLRRRPEVLGAFVGEVTRAWYERYRAERAAIDREVVSARRGLSALAVLAIDLVALSRALHERDAAVVAVALDLPSALLDRAHLLLHEPALAARHLRLGALVAPQRRLALQPHVVHRDPREPLVL